MAAPRKDWSRQLNRAFAGFVLWSIGIYSGGCLWSWMDYRAHPERYALHSAPWYILELAPRTATLLAVLAVGGLVYWGLRRWLRRR